ncbi:cellulase family glycosylhydrolase [Aquimarina sp. W85]|uniref:cellulase family glycosylhydrolase n=1 Tax=Aquimarina rhodophyticola TaxID=3342246 RepID=UPI00366EB365
MNKRYNKLFYRILLVSSFLLVNIAVLFGISQVLSFLNTGADRTSMLHINFEKKEVYRPKLLWQDSINPGRPIEKFTMRSIQSDYLKSWYVRQNSFAKTETIGISDYFTQNAKKKLVEHVNYLALNKTHIAGTTLSHNLNLDFLSSDGQLAICTDKNVRAYQKVYHKGELIQQGNTVSTYKIVFLLEDGFWKIRHMVKQPVTKQLDTFHNTQYFTIKNDKVYYKNKRFKIKGVNYYPKDSPWDMFGEEFDIDKISKDFELIKTSGLNTLRIFLQYEDFGKDHVKKGKLKKLDAVLKSAEKLGLKVIVTLFDFYGDYSVLDWTLTHRHAEQIVSYFSNNQTILAWDIKNEPDLDFENRGEEEVIAWLEEMVYQVKKHAPKQLVTIGWSTIDKALVLNDKVDLLSFHYYEDIKYFADKYKTLQTNSEQPLILGEFGISSNFGFWAPFGKSETDQANYHKQFQELIKKNQINFMSWTLYDFTKIPISVVGRLPWRKKQQQHFGFIDKSGNKKPSFKYINYE